jgi:orotate phosphoribosyltransferase
MSSLKAVDALHAVDAKVMGMVAIFTYGFDVAEKAFKDKNVELVTLSDYSHLLEQASDTDYIANEDKMLLEEWRIAPNKWKQNN